MKTSQQAYTAGLYYRFVNDFRYLGGLLLIKTVSAIMADHSVSTRLFWKESRSFCYLLDRCH